MTSKHDICRKIEADLRAYAEQLEAERDSYKTAAELAVESQNQAQSDAERAEKRVRELEAALRGLTEFCEQAGYDCQRARSLLPDAAQVSQPVGAVVARRIGRKTEIKQWDSRVDESEGIEREDAMMAEIAELRAALSEPRIHAPFGFVINEFGDSVPAEAPSAALVAQTAAPGVNPVTRLPETEVLSLAGKHATSKSTGNWYNFSKFDLDAFAVDLMDAISAPAAPLDISGLTAYEVCELSQSNIVYLAADVQALINAQRDAK